MITLHDTLAFVHEMHEGAIDWTGIPYVMHPIWVMMSLPASCDEDTRHLALMHDVVEDCKERLCAKFGITAQMNDQVMINIEDLFTALCAKGYSAYMMQGLRLLTRDLWRHLTYINYVRNIVHSDHIGAMWVKLKDNEHNTDPHRHTLLLPEYVERYVQIAPRYERSKVILREGLTIA